MIMNCNSVIFPFLLQNGYIFGLPFTSVASISGGSAVSSNIIGGNVLATAVMFSTGSTTSTCSSSVSDVGNNLFDGSVANAIVL